MAPSCPGLAQGIFFSLPSTRARRARSPRRLGPVRNLAGLDFLRRGFSVLSTSDLCCCPTFFVANASPILSLTCLQRLTCCSAPSAFGVRVRQQHLALDPGPVLTPLGSPRRSSCPYIISTTPLSLYSRVLSAACVLCTLFFKGRRFAHPLVLAQSCFSARPPQPSVDELPIPNLDHDSRTTRQRRISSCHGVPRTQSQRLERPHLNLWCVLCCRMAREGLLLASLHPEHRLTPRSQVSSSCSTAFFR